MIKIMMNDKALRMCVQVVVSRLLMRLWKELGVEMEIVFNSPRILRRKLHGITVLMWKTNLTKKSNEAVKIQIWLNERAVNF